MKLRAIWVLGCLVACALAPMGCAKPGLAGTSWQASRVELDTGSTVKGEDAFIISGDLSLAFLDELRCTRTDWRGTVEGAYTLEGDTLTLTLDGNVTECTYNGKEIGIGPDKIGLTTYLTRVDKQMRKSSSWDVLFFIDKAHTILYDEYK